MKDFKRLTDIFVIITDKKYGHLCGLLHADKIFDETDVFQTTEYENLKTLYAEELPEAYDKNVIKITSLKGLYKEKGWGKSGE
ncbi:MAG: hypothetical protein JSV92_04225 [archaeon]|nr:MAG: hypothetical protein JSV92_04225 [archaeon]